MDFLSLTFLFIALFAAGLAIFALVRHRGTPGHLCFAIGLLLLAAETFIAGIPQVSSSAANSFSLEIWKFLPKSLLPGFWLLFSLRYSRGESPTPHATLLFVAAVFAVPAASVFLFQEHLFQPLLVDSPDLPIGFSGYIYYVLSVVASSILLVNLEKTFRAAVGTYRWRIKFVILGVALLFTGRIYTASQILIFQSYFPTVDIINATTLFVACCFFAIAFSRPETFKVAVYPSEKVLRFSLTSILLAVYLVVVGVSSKLLRYWEGPNAFATKALLLLFSLSALAVFLLSERNRDFLHRFVSRHLRRSMYDYRSIWLSFTEQTTSIASAEALCHVLVKWLSEEFHVLSTSIWLAERNTTRFRSVASTGAVKDAVLEIDSDNFQQIQRALTANPVPFDLDGAAQSWAAKLKELFAGSFKRGGNSVCVPLVAKGELLGLIALCDRVNNISIGQQEFDLLKCIADQVASNLLNFQLSSHLLQAKEMEAFQTISAFFVHDLKNTSSTLNLTLQNLPKHFDNPEFRKDALKAISKSVAHIQELISRLTLFRQKLEIHPRQVDLNDLLKTTLASAGGSSLIETRFSSDATVFADEDQLQKVFTNLLLNAREATNGNGHITLSTSQQNGWTIASISDTGCGMSSDFISQSLFKPFKTTKKGGMGIGMFQSKTIVEAHNGKIEVESRQGAGTTFRVFLPVKTAVT
jgi:putative PEP-CTERM system histidine kinase